MNSGSHSQVQLENDHFRVTRWTIEPGGSIPMHRHAFEYVVVPVSTVTMHVVPADAAPFDAHLVAGVSYTRPAGSEHRIENHGTTLVDFVEVERLT